jgi:putative restriction endonuclease
MSKLVKDRWQRVIANLHTWKSGEERAVHKPLLTLMLLARAARGESSRVPFEEIEETLTQLLREFGPRRKPDHPEYPFWYLQNDGFWIVENVDSFGVKKGGCPTKNTLLVKHAVGLIPDELWAILQEDEEILGSVCQQILYEFWPDTYRKSICQAIGLPDIVPGISIKLQKPRDPKFRIEVLRAYERRCAICGYDGRIGDSLMALDAAHIWFHASNGPDLVENGLALCSFHHVAFDRGAIGLSNDRTILISCDMTGGDMVKELLVRFGGRPIREPQSPFPRPDRKYLQWHKKYVFKAPAREDSAESLSLVAENYKKYDKK